MCTNLSAILLQAALVISLGELYYLDIASVTSKKKYPVCVPWWENEHGERDRSRVETQLEVKSSSSSRGQELKPN